MAEEALASAVATNLSDELEREDEEDIGEEDSEDEEEYDDEDDEDEDDEEDDEDEDDEEDEDEDDGVYNIVTNKLEVITLNKTRLINKQDFEFKGYMKIISFFMPSAFKKQSRIILESFKNFAEERNNNFNRNN